MTVPNPYQAYKQNAAQTASPGDLTLMLYNGCLKFIKRAKHAIENDSLEEKNTHILKAQDIIRELMATLDMKQEIAQNMMQLYDFMLNQLIEANLQNDVQKLSEVEELLVEFHETWQQVIQMNRRKQYGTSNQV